MGKFLATVRPNLTRATTRSIQSHTTDTGLSLPATYAMTYRLAATVIYTLLYHDRTLWVQARRGGPYAFLETNRLLYLFRVGRHCG